MYNTCTSCIHGRFQGKKLVTPKVAQNSELNTKLTGKEEQGWTPLRGE